MEYNKLIAQLEIGDEVEGFYILKTAQARVSNSGKPFLSAVLADRSGAIEAKVWDYGGAEANRSPYRSISFQQTAR